ncbi:MAG: histidine kinase, partial [Bacteroidota bacterium]|nr:histidine kinase [Bacteroidota bacterium]
MFANPLFKNIKYLGLYAFIWGFIMFSYLLLVMYVGDNSLYGAFIDSAASNLSLAVLGLFVWYSARYISFEENSLLKFLSAHFISGIILSVLWVFLVYGIIFYFPIGSYRTFWLNTLPFRFLFGSLIYYLLIAFYYTIIYYNNFQEKLIKENELNNLVTRAEIKTLKFQINPHFIFNSLNSISALTSIDPERAKSMILKLADFLRYTLSNNDTQQNKLSDEIKNIKLYLEIEKIRFEDKFEYNEELNTDCSDVNVPNMILQPLFENAIKHAVYETLDTVTLKLKCEKINNYLNISLEN